MNVTKTFSRASTLKFVNGSTGADKKKSLSADFFFKFQSFRISYFLLLCKVWKHKVKLICKWTLWLGIHMGFKWLYTTKQTRRLAHHLLHCHMIWTHRLRSWCPSEKLTIIVIRSKYLKLHIITLILSKIIPNNLDIQLIFVDN